MKIKYIKYILPNKIDEIPGEIRFYEYFHIHK